MGVSGKRRRPRNGPQEAAPGRSGSTTRPPAEFVDIGPDGVPWVFRRITGSTSVKTYRCPGCDQEIRPATPHIVAWPEGDVESRRHWHTACWHARGRRGGQQRRRPV
ncbi:conserved hypothetical protein [Acidothermus cellulolyticus 11B]|uniref:ATP/GTP-binding protein n=1 Tax=Acidothermus cellulolyticus (strain ATCC 43068 / DSM 8971 / 11B) TaxID=351607 RepID=A0LSN1_ACIC1|nr:conserved hypothetical protein [Acidothermus cellulolyticus 11B]